MKTGSVLRGRSPVSIIAPFPSPPVEKNPQQPLDEPRTRHILRGDAVQFRNHLSVQQHIHQADDIPLRNRGIDALRQLHGQRQAALLPVFSSIESPLPSASGTLSALPPRTSTFCPSKSPLFAITTRRYVAKP